MLNALKQAVEDKVKAARRRLQGQGFRTRRHAPLGRVPLAPTTPAGVRREIVDIFQNMGFAVAEGPEIEDDWHVFSGLNSA